MKRNRNYGSSTAFLDLLFNTLLAFVAFFMLALMLISEKSESKPTEVKNVEFLITSTWPYQWDDDVDIYVVDPLNNITSFNRREDGLMHLDRDDLGNKNDTITLPNGKKIDYKENREVVSIRGIVPGEYIVNSHLYSKKTTGEPTPVSIKIEKMNPYKLVAHKEIRLATIGEEQTVFRFGINKNGDIDYVSDGPQKKLIKKKGE